MKKFFIRIFLIIFIANMSISLFSQNTVVTQDFEKDDKAAQVFKDIRRFEIITLGAMPFVMLDTTLVYSGVNWIKNDFSSDYTPGFNQKFTEKEQIGLVLTSLGICIGIGITDLIINLVTRNNNKRAKDVNNSISVLPISQDPDATIVDFNNTFNLNTENGE